MNKKQISIRPTTSADAETLGKIQKAAFLSLYEKYHDSGSPYLRGAEDILKRLNKDNRYYTILLDGEIVGGIFYKLTRGFPNKVLGDGEYYLCRVYIHPEFQCMGIAREAILMCEREFADANTFYVDFPDDMERNRKCYSNAGYCDTGEKFYADGVPTLAMYKKTVDVPTPSEITMPMIFAVDRCELDKISNMVGRELESEFDRGVKMYGLYAGKKIIGFVSFENTEENTVTIKDIYILPEYEGRGFDMQLISFVKDFEKKSIKKILVTGGTVFVSKFVANYFKKEHDVYVLNRNTREQLDGITLIEVDRNNLGDKLREYHFDVIIDVCAYNENHVNSLLDAANAVEDYILISSSAVYPETNPQPFSEEQMVGENKIWGSYGTNKIRAEEALLARRPTSYIIRPPYLYGPMENVYREPFVFECALQDREFYIPEDGKMKLQFFHVEDLCRVIEAILDTHPSEHIFNVGNEGSVDINEFVSLCYKVAGKSAKIINVYDGGNWRNYFSFSNYEYALDVTRQKQLISTTKDLEEGLRESFEWYVNHPNDVIKKGYIDFIDTHLRIR